MSKRKPSLYFKSCPKDHFTTKRLKKSSNRCKMDDKSYLSSSINDRYFTMCYFYKRSYSYPKENIPT